MKDKHNKLKLNYKSNNPLVAWYFNRQMNILIRFAKPNPKDLILDFGCGNQMLKQKLKEYNVIGYDKNKENSDINDYTTLKPDFVFASHVFEHLSESEFQKALTDFRVMNESMIIVTALPRKNLLANILCFVLMRPPYTHQQSFKQVIENLENHLMLIQQQGVGFIAHCGKWRFKHKRQDIQ